MMRPWMCYAMAVVAVALAVGSITLGGWLAPVAAIVDLASAAVLVYSGRALRRVGRTP